MLPVIYLFLFDRGLLGTRNETVRVLFHFAVFIVPLSALAWVRGRPLSVGWTLAY